MRIPMSTSTFLEVQVPVVPLQIPFLLGLEVFVHYGLNLNFNKMRLEYRDTGISVPITLFDKHAYVHARKGGQDDFCKDTMILFNRNELKKLHLQFFHPHPTQLFNLIRRARPEQAD